MCTESLRFAAGGKHKYLFPYFGFLLLFAVLLIDAACVQNPPTNQPSNNPPSSPSNAATNTAVPSKPSAASLSPVTLPLVDAVLQDNSFVNDAKSSLQITDEQMQKLKDAARDDVLTLDETDADNTRSTRAAVKKADTKIKQIMGDEKGDQFINFVRDCGAGINPETA